MAFYLPIRSILEIGEKQNWKTIMSLVELSAGGVASEITKNFTENTNSLIKKGYLRVNLCYS